MASDVLNNSFNHLELECNLMNHPFKFLKSSEREGDDKGNMLIYVYKSPWGLNDDSEDSMCSAEQSL